MLENLRRKSLTKTYHDPIHQIHFELGCAHCENPLSIYQCINPYKQKLSKKKINRPFPKAFNQVSKEFRLFHFRLDAIKFNMIACLSGSFTMGHKDQSDNKPRNVKIKSPFLLGETEITQELYQAVMEDNPSEFKHPQNPVENVSWADAIKFCNELSRLQGLDECYTKNSSQEYDWLCDFTKNGYRLPTEKEWEYAAKAGTENRWAGTDDEINLGEYAWFGGSSEINEKKQTQPVGSKAPNEWGFYDMSGNVYEWCWDKYYPKGDADASRVIRGGGWSSNFISFLCSARRGLTLPGLRYNDLGFRVCRIVI